MRKRKPFISGNWKMYKTCSESLEAVEKLKQLVADINDIEIMIAPPFTSLFPISNILKGSQILLSAQNLHWEKEGAFTGEISPRMIASVGCTHVIIGHSERRQIFSETDAVINKKITAAMQNKLIPVFCIGETEEQRDKNETKNVLDKQLIKGLQNVALNDPNEFIIAYEPVWAIGTGKTATAEQAQEVHDFIRKNLRNGYGETIADKLRILYGGSVKPENINELMAMPDVDGVLVGGASLNPETFSKIAHFRR